jgi:hypothetical protein
LISEFFRAIQHWQRIAASSAPPKTRSYAAEAIRFLALSVVLDLPDADAARVRELVTRAMSAHPAVEGDVDDASSLSTRASMDLGPP